jgi:hypothetical protein
VASIVKWSLPRRGTVDTEQGVRLRARCAGIASACFSVTRNAPPASSDERQRLLLRRDMETTERRESGLDVFDLAEFPISVLGDAAPAGLLLLEFSDGNKSWQVSADPRYGLPTAIDVEVYVALVAASRGHSPHQNIPFRRRPLIQSLGWNDRGDSYDRLTLALRRWSHTRITALNAVHDPKTGTWREETGFQILESFRIYHRNGSQEAPWACWFRWGGQIADLLAAGYHHELDVATYMQLKSPIAQAEFRYLSAKVRDGKETFEQHLSTYAQQHIGLRQQYVSKIKEKLAPSHRQLLASGFLRSVEYGVMKSGPHRGEAKITVRVARRMNGTAVEMAALPSPTLADRLADAGVTRATAEQLAAEMPGETEAQLDYWPHRDHTGMKNPAGALVKAIREKWAAPEEWRQAQAQAQKRAEAKQRRSQQEAAEKQDAAAASGFDAWWETLPQPDREALTARARAELIGNNATLTTYYQRNPDRLPEALRPIMMRLSAAAADDRS